MDGSGWSIQTGTVLEAVEDFLAGGGPELNWVLQPTQRSAWFTFQRKFELQAYCTPLETCSMKLSEMGAN